MKHPHFPTSFPEVWAGEWGEDEFGLWNALIYRGVRQGFRWIQPGTFLMGSPESEAERLNNETQHEVILTQGFWLADSACTQALWRAVMGENPSQFQEDENHPVEQVSWHDVQGFISRLNSTVPELNARLPSEAEWEYACRAGTTTPFSFGANITPEQVNYDGDYPYKGGENGLFRGKTVPVKSLPANPWGLYEVHGNVWEWCEDRYGDYPPGPVTDPQGPATGALRVLRGGSWDRDGRYVRSARRSYIGPDSRLDHIGFRLALGQTAVDTAVDQIIILPGRWWSRRGQRRTTGRPRRSGAVRAGAAQPNSCRGRKDEAVREEAPPVFFDRESIRPGVFSELPPRQGQRRRHGLRRPPKQRWIGAKPCG